MKVMHLFRFCFSMVLLNACIHLCAQEKPNILIIMTDELSAESMSFNLGNKYINTPNIDQLAKTGVVFSNAYCANPLCVPSRSSIFTGRYPHELGIQNNEEKKIDPKVFPSLGSIFKNAGYETGYVGKWHLPYDRKATDTHGFDYLPNKTGNGHDSTSPNLADDFFKAKRDNPFLLVVSFMNPHNICQWARGEKLPDGPIGDPPAADQCPPLRPNARPSVNESDIMKFMRTSMQNSDAFPVGGFTEQKWRQYIWSYYRLIEKVDAEIGRVLQSLKASGKDKNTIIVFTSDHGDMQGAHLWNQKTVFYEEAAKVPFIINYQGLKPEGRMIRNGQYKYWIYDEGTTRESLFDLKNDPGEMINLVNDPRHAKALQECRSQLMEWAKKYNDPYLTKLIK